MAEIDSTNDAAKRAAKLGAPSGATFVAEVQRSGRGRQGRTWFGARGESILASVLVRLQCEPRNLPPITLACGLAVRDAVARAITTRALLKWPNDVLVGGRKVAGVLVEAVIAGKSVEAVVIGFGINVHQRSFPDEIAERATSVAMLAATPPERAEILADVLAGIDHDVAHVAARGLGLIHARITEADALAGRRIQTDEGVRGEALGIDVSGALRVRRDDGTLVGLHAGEVHLAT